MKQYEVPMELVYKGEECCPYPLGISEDDFYLRRQWFFEKHYAESTYNWDIPFRERFHFTNGFEQYLYYKGEDECPSYFKQGEAGIWWDFEQRHWRANGDPPYVFPFIIFFRNWTVDKAAGNVGHSIELSGNPWLDRYLKDAPL